jgi:Amt family ammonium transporter
VIGSLAGVAYAAAMGFVVYGLLKKTLGIRLSAEDEHRGADLSIHQISATPEADMQP